MIVTIVCRDIISCRVTIVLCNGAQIGLWDIFKGYAIVSSAACIRLVFLCGD